MISFSICTVVNMKPLMILRYQRMWDLYRHGLPRPVPFLLQVILQCLPGGPDLLMHVTVMILMDFEGVPDQGQGRFLDADALENLFGVMREFQKDIAREMRTGR